ncbi:MAG: hypothetical protein WB696_12800 [Chthoniobacterales bacterium]
MTDDKLGGQVCLAHRADIDLADVLSITNRLLASFVICHLIRAEGENDGVINTAAPLREARILPGSSAADGAPQAWIEGH